MASRCSAKVGQPCSRGCRLCFQQCWPQGQRSHQWAAVVNTPGATLRENLVPLNFPGPNAVLFQLLTFLVEAAREVASIKDVLSGEIPGANTPGILGLAVIQQGLKVFSSIYKRIHRSLRQEYEKLFRLNRIYLPDETGYRIGAEYFRITRADYAEGAGVEPV